MQNLWQVHHQSMPINIIQDFIKFDGNMDTMIKNVKHAKFNINIANIILNTHTLKLFLI